MNASIYRALTMVAGTYGLFFLGSKAVNVVVRAGIAWPGCAAMATVLLVGYAGVMVYRAQHAS